MTIGESIMEFVKIVLKRESYYTVIGVATNISESTRTCDVTPLEGAKIYGCRLQSIESSSKGIVQIPKEDSKVAVTFRNRETGIVTLCEEIDKYIITVGNSELIITADLFKFNGGSEELINITELTTKLNNLKSEVNDLITEYNAHIHETTATIGATAVVGVISPTTSTGTPVTAFNKNDYKDDKIKH